MSTNGHAETAPAEPAKKISREDMLRVENLYLKMQHAAMQEQIMKRDLLRLHEDQKKWQEEMAALGAEYAQKYGIELGRAKILPDGSIETKR